MWLGPPTTGVPKVTTRSTSCGQPSRDLARDHAAEAPADEADGTPAIAGEGGDGLAHPLDVALDVAEIGPEAPGAGVVAEPAQVRPDRRHRCLRGAPAGDVDDRASVAAGHREQARRSDQQARELRAREHLAGQQLPRRRAVRRDRGRGKGVPALRGPDESDGAPGDGSDASEHAGNVARPAAAGSADAAQLSRGKSSRSRIESRSSSSAAQEAIRSSAPSSAIRRCSTASSPRPASAL